MGNWMRRVGDLLGGRTLPPAAAAPPRAASHAEPARSPTATPATAAGPEADVVEPDLQQLLFSWVIGTHPAAPAPLHPREHSLIAHLDAVARADDSRAALLPRASAVIPQLLNSLRDQNQSAEALALRVRRDPHLVAEVIRMANSASKRAAAPVADIAEAIGRLGTDGLQDAIARVVLKPMFGGNADTLSARCAQRLWQHSEAKAAACRQEAAARGCNPFEGYLTGLLHNSGWSAALRAIERSEGGAPREFSTAFAAAFEPRRESLFAKLVLQWQLTDGVTALGAELLTTGLAAARSPLGQALRAADERASREMLGAAGLLGSLEVVAKH